MSIILVYKINLVDIYCKIFGSDILYEIKIIMNSFVD